MRWLAVLIALAVLAVPAQASVMLRLFNTGVDNIGSPLPDGTVGDPHYSLVSAPAGSVLDIRVKTSTSGFPVGPWIGDDSVSTWIGPNNDSALDGPGGAYDYRTKFQLPSAGTLSVTGRWATDNPALGIYLNSSILVDSGNSNGFQTWTPFSFTAAGVSGLNTLDFLVRNDGGPTGLRVEFGSVSFTPAVPEPTTIGIWSLLGALAIGLGWWRRR